MFNILASRSLRASKTNNEKIDLLASISRIDGEIEDSFDYQARNTKVSVNDTLEEENNNKSLIISQ